MHTAKQTQVPLVTLSNKDIYTCICLADGIVLFEAFQFFNDLMF